MLTKRDIEYIRSLHKAKGRAEAGQFIAEGVRLVHDSLGAFGCALLIYTDEHAELLQPALKRLPLEMRPRRIEVADRPLDLKRLSTQQTPQSVIAVFDLPQPIPIAQAHQGLCLLLDHVQDPGNVGTIIRTADWFGVRDVVLTLGCADPFSPKVVQSTMGALSRVHIHRLEDDGVAFASSYPGHIMGALLDGDNIYTTSLPHYHSDVPRLLIVGNEGNGISPSLVPYIAQRLTIPCLATEGTGAESLNVGIATAICLSELCRPRST